MLQTQHQIAIIITFCNCMSTDTEIEKLIYVIACVILASLLISSACFHLFLWISVTTWKCFIWLSVGNADL